MQIYRNGVVPINPAGQNGGRLPAKVTRLTPNGYFSPGAQLKTQSQVWFGKHQSSGVRMFRAKTTMIAALLILLSAGQSFGQSSYDDATMQPLISSLRACAKSNVAEAYAAGIRRTREAEEFLQNRCAPVISIELRKAMEQGLKAVPPGRFRFTVREEWAMFMADQPPQ
jgi:hypothetical protein